MDKGFNWGNDGLFKTISFLKKNGINWKNIPNGMRKFIVLSSSMWELEFWLNNTMDYIKRIQG